MTRVHKQCSYSIVYNDLWIIVKEAANKKKHGVIPFTTEIPTVLHFNVFVFYFNSSVYNTEPSTYCLKASFGEKKVLFVALQFLWHAFDKVRIAWVRD